MAKSSTYWQGRFDQIEQSANNRSTKYVKQLEKKYQIAAQQIDGQINAWYQRIAANNEVSMTEARKLLSSSELKEFKWTVEDYIKYGQENAIDQRWMKELENASAKFHISRLEAMKIEARQQIELATGGMVDDVDTLLKNVYSDTFYRSCFEMQKGIGVGFDVSKLDGGKVSRILSKPWSVDGTNFSEKLWSNKAKLINNLDQELSRMILTGESPKKAIANIKKVMGSSLASAKRLVMTEQAFFTSAAQVDAYGELDVEEYEFVGTLDGRTCGDCGDLDGKHFPVAEMAVGINAPPMHPYCRCTTCPYFDDEFTNGLRASRDESGKTVYEVPEKMTYKEWKKSFVDGGDKSDLTPMASESVLDNVQKNDGIPAKKVTERKTDVLNDNKDIAEYKLKKKEYDDAVHRLDELDKESDKLLDDYMLGMDTDRADELNKKFEAKFVEEEEYKKYVEELKHNLAPYESKAIKSVESALAKLVDVDIAKVKLEGLPYESAEIWYRKTDSILSKYPQLKDNITSIKYDADITKMMDAGTKPLTGEVYIGKPFTDYKKMMKDYAEDVANGYSPQGTNASSVITHEFGHLLDGYLTKTKKAGLVNQYGVKYASEHLVNDVLKDMNITTKEGIFKDVPFKERLAVREKWIAENISKYASKDNKEAFAELFAEYVDSPNPSPVAKELGKRVEKLLGNDIVEDALENIGDSDIIASGARIFNPESKEGRTFAKMYYPEIRSFSTDCEHIAKNIGKSQKDIEKVKEYLFFTDDFEPDCAIAQSWQRLMQGNDIKKHDYTLIEHELYEMDIKKQNPDLSHYEAHELATKKYNYQKEVDEYYGDLDKPKKSE